MYDDIHYLLTWVPVFAFPSSHIVQIYKMFVSDQIKDISALTFFGFFLGNMGAYLFSGKYFDIRTLLSFVLTAILEIVIIAIIQYRNDNMETFWVIIITSMMIIYFTFFLIFSQHKYLKSISSFAGFFPALLFPIATILQLVKIVNKGNVYGVSCKAWILQIVANIGAYLLIGKLADLKSILGFLLTAFIDIFIVLAYGIYGGNFSHCFKL